MIAAGVGRDGVDVEVIVNQRKAAKDKVGGHM
jgi:hypothetical protein